MELDKAVELLREYRAKKAEERATRIYGRVKTLNIADYPVGTRIAFTKLFDRRDRVYSYLALKVLTSAGTALWFVTGMSGSLTDDQFEELLAEHGGFDAFDEII